MTHPWTAVVLGASGSVGEALVQELLGCGSCHLVVSLVRRSQGRPVAIARAQRVELREVLVPNMSPSSLEAATVGCLEAIEGRVVGFTTLGVGAQTARLSLEGHRAIDVRLNEAFARGLERSSKVGHLAMLSAVGADATASPRGSGAAGMPRYARVKGEAEQAVIAAGPKVVRVFRPAMILGSRHTPKLLAHLVPLFSWVTPDRFRSISCQQIARAMVADAGAQPPASGILYHAEMMALCAKFL